MPIKQRLIRRFPLLYEAFYELRTSRMIRMNRAVPPSGRPARLAALYRRRTGHALNLAAPVRYTEKMQWRKLYGLRPEFAALSDKIAVRAWVAQTIGEPALIPLLGCYRSFDEIDFGALPQQFVLKTNNASGANWIVRDRRGLNLPLMKRRFDYWMKMEYAYLGGYEMQYQAIRPAILAEALLTGQDGDAPRDYKFLCFDGVVRYIWVDEGRFERHRRTVYDRDWQLQPWNQRYPVQKSGLPRPAQLTRMIGLAERLAQGFDHVRVDLYCTEEHIYFGEMTFTNGSGFEPIVPDAFDAVLGSCWHLGKGVDGT